LEFSSPKFPDVAALLNPQHHASTFPLTAAIVTVRGVLKFGSVRFLTLTEYNLCTDGGESS
jgi:hypothetical protein